MRTFVAVWLGQLVSTLGSGLTSFALGVWIYKETGSPTLLAVNLLVVLYILGSLLILLLPRVRRLELELPDVRMEGAGALGADEVSRGPGSCGLGGVLCYNSRIRYQRRVSQKAR